MPIATRRIEALTPQRQGYSTKYTLDNIIGSDSSIQSVLKQAAAASKMMVPVLIQGESGTGKELMAQSIHDLSRAKGPFVPVNCGALPRNLAESEMFGYESGTFTGADRKGRMGKFEQANGGTLFLDEIGDMPLSMQPVLLRVIEEKQVMRLGGAGYIPLDIRIVAATNRDLLNMVQTKHFREDLYYRLSAFSIHLPRLKERGQDIRNLAEHFISRVCKEMGISSLTLTEEVWEKILSYDWPGNIRQMENAMAYAASMAQNGVITLADLPRDIINPPIRANEPRQSMIPTLQESETRAIQQAIDFTMGNVPEAARLLGVARSTLYRKLQELEITRYN
ncbi:MAG: sigma 54-interacting transcriptional regulator [Bacillota bacterium]|nr:sigma 54-interacting transcriptional regulator [Bacillota bacterium]